MAALTSELLSTDCARYSRPTLGGATGEAFGIWGSNDGGGRGVPHLRASSTPQLPPTKWPLCLKGHFLFSWGGRCYLGCPPGDPHVEGVVTADLGVGQPPALLVGFHEGGLLVRQDVAHDHGGPSNQRCLRKMGKAVSSLLFPHPSLRHGEARGPRKGIQDNHRPYLPRGREPRRQQGVGSCELPEGAGASVEPSLPWIQHTNLLLPQPGLQLRALEKPLSVFPQPQPTPASQ